MIYRGIGFFSLKDPRKPKDAANKFYVDDTINKRIEEEKAKFLPQDPASKNYVDEAIRKLVGGDTLVSKEGVFIKENGHYRATAPLDIDNNKMENLPEPEDDGDAATKKYVDDVAKSLTLEGALVKENGGYNLSGKSYINMNFGSIRNLEAPVQEWEAATKGYVDNVVRDEVGSNINNVVGKAISGLIDKAMKQRPHLITANSSYHGDLIKDDYQFTFGGSSVESYKKHNKYNGFVMPQSGYIKRFVVKDTGYKLPNDYKNEERMKYVLEHCDEDLNLSITNPEIIPIFTLVVIKHENYEAVELGVLNMEIKLKCEINNGNYIGKIGITYSFKSSLPEGIEKYHLSTKDILNIRTEITSPKSGFFIISDGWEMLHRNNKIFEMLNPILKDFNQDTDFFTYLTTILIELDPLDD